MNHRIGIEPALTPIKEFLTAKGYKVENIEFSNDIAQYDALVVSGQSINFMGIQDTGTKATIIDASGLKPDEVYEQLKTRLQ